MNVIAADPAATGGLPSPPNFTNFNFLNNTADGPQFDGGSDCSNPAGAVMRFTGVDGVDVSGNTQQISTGAGCGRLVDGNNIADGRIEYNELLNAVRVATVNTLFAACESNNDIGPSPMHPAPLDPNTYAC